MMVSMPAIPSSLAPDGCLCSRHEGAEEGIPHAHRRWIRRSTEGRRKRGPQCELLGRVLKIRLRQIGMARCDVLKLRQWLRCQYDNPTLVSLPYCVGPM